MSCAPIALFVYNRPHHTEQVVEALKKNSESEQSDLYIFSDAPKNGTSKDNVKLVREYIRTIQGFKSVSIVEREKNLGLANSIITGVTDIVNKYNKIIVLEDDLVVSPYFLEYMNKSLGKYEVEDKVMQISGYMFPIELKSKSDAIFLPFTTSWGWATWQRSWDHFDCDMLGYETLKVDRKLRYQFDLDGALNYWEMLEAQHAGKIDSWAIRWYLTVFMLKGLTLHPARSLVRNIGFDGSGTHCGQDYVKRNFERDFHVFSFPDKIDVSEVLINIKKYLRNVNSSPNKIKEGLNGFFKRHFTKD
jgi:hypothetical protein